MKKRALFLLIFSILCIGFLDKTEAANIGKKQAYDTYNGGKTTYYYYLLNDNGNRISSRTYHYLEKINSNLFIAQKGNLFTLINEKEEPTLPYEFMGLTCLKNNVILVKTKVGYYLMNNSGYKINSGTYKYIGKIDNTLLKFANGTPVQGGQNVNPNTLTPPTPDAASETQQSIDSGNVYGIMDYKGNIIAEPMFKSIARIDNYMIKVSVAGGNGENAKNKYGIINNSGKYILRPEYDYIGFVNSTTLSLKKGNYWARADMYKGNILNIQYATSK